MDILSAVCSILNVDLNSVEVCYAFVKKRKIKKLNKEFRSINRVTDVLSFPDGDINPETNKRFMGDVIICKAVAKKQAKLYGHTVEREITFLQVHGTLHLFGFDHLCEEDDTKMRGLQRQIMALLF